MVSSGPAPSLSVVTRTLNRPVFLKRAARSIKAQTRSDIEWVIVNDGGAADPVDEVAAEAAAHGLKTIVVHRQANNGMAAASNAGIQASSAALIALHDDDDTWQPEFVERTVTFLEDNARPAGVCTQVNLVAESFKDGDIIEKSRFVMNGDLRSLNIADNLVHNRVVPIAFVYRRGLHDALGWYNDKMAVMDDWDFVLRVIESREIHVIPEPLANYHQRFELQDQSDPASNTVVSGQELHSRVDSEMRDGMLRAEIARGHVGFGFLATIARINIRNDELLRHYINAVKQVLVDQCIETRKTMHSTAFDRYKQVDELKSTVTSRLDDIRGDQSRASDGLRAELTRVIDSLTAISKQAEQSLFEQSARAATINSMQDGQASLLERLARCETLLDRLSSEREMSVVDRLKRLFAARPRNPSK